MFTNAFDIELSLIEIFLDTSAQYKDIRTPHVVRSYSDLPVRTRFTKRNFVDWKDRTILLPFAMCVSCSLSSTILARILDLSSVYPLFAAVIRLVAVETDAIVSGISMSHSVQVPRRGRKKTILSFHPPVDSRRLLATSAAPRSEGRAQIGLSSGEVASGKSQEWRVASDMLPRGGGLVEATRPLLTIPSLAVETSDAALSLVLSQENAG